jgi:hypothetical protein
MAKETYRVTLYYHRPGDCGVRREFKVPVTIDEADPFTDVSDIAGEKLGEVARKFHFDYEIVDEDIVAVS